jgi:hypothetical protein
LLSSASQIASKAARKSFSDPKIPKDFTTYGIQAINGEIWVTFTALNAVI